MSAILPFEARKQFSLRSHSAPVACLCAWNNQLVSADRLGEVIVWDLGTRRASARWRAHEGHILSMRPTALGLMTHGRDSAVRFWREPGAICEPVPTPGPTAGPTEITSVTSTLASNSPLHCVFEMPINSLNFCNVAVSHDNGAVILATPASVDSDGVDIYRLSPALALSRVAQNAAAPTEISAAGARGHGIVMRLEWGAGNLYVGYESGALAAFTVAALGAQLVWLAPAHTPHPVLSLSVVPTGPNRHTVRSGSASKTVLVHEFVAGSAPHQQKHNLRHYGIQSLETSEDMVVAGFWDGVIKGYDLNWTERFRLERARQHIEVEATPGRKSVCVLVWTPEAGGDGSRRALLRLRRASTRLLFVGHEDGLVTAYTM